MIADVVRRYDVDGVHRRLLLSHPIKATGDRAGDELPFPDQPSWTRYRQHAGLFAWRDRRLAAQQRRSSVRDIYSAVHAIKPWVKVGVSPFGIGRPDRRPAGIAGFSQYDKLYADVEHWLRAGWLDYLAPQLYWPIDREARAFAVLLTYWAARTGAGAISGQGALHPAGSTTAKSPGNRKRSASKSRCSAAQAGRRAMFISARRHWYRTGRVSPTVLAKTTYVGAALVPSTLGYGLLAAGGHRRRGSNSLVRRWRQP